MACQQPNAGPKCPCLPCMKSVGRPLPYRNECGCVVVDGMDMLRNQMMTQKISACGNDTRHPQPDVEPTFPPDTPSCVTNGQYLPQVLVGTTSTVGGSQTQFLYNRTRRDASSFGGYVYYDTEEFWYPYPAGYCGRGKQSGVLYQPGARFQ